MRGNSDLSETYPFSVAPANGWGNPNPSEEWVIANDAAIGKAVKIEADGSFEDVEYLDATRFSDASTAAIASGRIAKQYKLAA